MLPAPSLVLEICTRETPQLRLSSNPPADCALTGLAPAQAPDPRLASEQPRKRVHVMPEAGEEVLAFPDTQARQLAGVSMRRLRYWEEAGHVVPSIKRHLSEHNTVRLYSYQDLLALLVVSALRTERDTSCARTKSSYMR